MVKKILILAISMFVVGLTPAMSQDNNKPTIEQDIAATAISVQGSTLHIKNAEDMSLEIYNITGLKVKSLRIGSSEEQVELSNLPKGCYIVKVGKCVRKVYIK